MTEKEIVKEAMKVRGYTQAMLAEKLNYKAQGCVADRLSSRGASMKIDTLLKMLDVLGYDLIIKDRNMNGETWKVELPK